MASDQEKPTEAAGKSRPETAKIKQSEIEHGEKSGIDRNAPAGSAHSLGAESVRDGRPAADDSVVEAIDEEGPGTSPTR